MTIEAHKVKVFQDSSGEWRWTASDTNGAKVATSGEGYFSKGYTKQAAKDLFPAAEIEVEDESHS